MSSRVVLFLLCVVLLACHAAPDCPEYMRQQGEPFDVNRWAQMSACAADFHGQALVDYLNSHQNSFTLEFRPAHLLRNGITGVNVPSNFTAEHRATTLADYDVSIPIPTAYDPRDDPTCGEVIGHITDQGNCSDCWAHATAGVMSDRICKQSGGKQKVLISPYDLTSCCSFCTPAAEKCSKGCHTSKAFYYISAYGVVTEQCKPVDSAMQQTDNPQCTPECNNPNQGATKYYGLPFYAFQQEEVIQREIMSKGSVVVDNMPVFEDFQYYKSGVYVNALFVDGAPTHAVRLIGWGDEDGLPYWIAANSWGTAAQENGFFRVIRGVNALYIEQNTGAADPRL